MDESESGGIFRPPMPPETPPSPVNIIFVSYSSVVTDVTSSSSDGGSGSGIAVVHRNININETDVTSSSGGGGGSAVLHQNININDHGGGGGEMMMKKRGRPRKYRPNGGLPPPAVGAATGAFEQQPHEAAAPPVSAAPVNSVPMEEEVALVKKARGRPPGSSKKKHIPESLGSAGFCFTPHIVVVQPGEDVLNKIMSFSQNGPMAVCIMSGIGVINNVTLRQAANSGGTTTYEGIFDILALSGSFVLSEGHGLHTRTGGLSVTLSGSDGQVFGGVVAGLLTAACPVQVMVGSLLPESCEEYVLANYGEPSVWRRRSHRLTMARYRAAHCLMGP